MLTTQTKYPAELNMLNDLFFKAPVGNFDSTTYNFFSNNDSFTCEIKNGDYAIQSGNLFVSNVLHYFYFKHHPVITGPFDTARIGFVYEIINGEPTGIGNILLDITFKNEEDCKRAYDLLAELLSKMDHLISPPEDKRRVSITTADFIQGKKLFLSIHKNDWPDPRIGTTFNVDLMTK